MVHGHANHFEQTARLGAQDTALVADKGKAEVRGSHQETESLQMLITSVSSSRIVISKCWDTKSSPVNNFLNYKYVICVFMFIFVKSIYDL